MRLSRLPRRRQHVAAACVALLACGCSHLVPLSTRQALNRLNVFRWTDVFKFGLIIIDKYLELFEQTAFDRYSTLNAF